MSNTSMSHETAEQHVKSIRRATRKQYPAEEKIRVVLEEIYVAKSAKPLATITTIKAQAYVNFGDPDFGKQLVDLFDTFEGNSTPLLSIPAAT